MKQCELIMVTPDNNNKYIRMFEQDNGMFKSEWGRVGQSPNETVYPLSKWNSYYNSKIKKGYRDVSDLKRKDAPAAEFMFNDPEISSFYNIFSNYTNSSVRHNYTIAVDSVTKAMLDEAQSILDSLVRLPAKDTFNKYLIDLFTVLPRKMSDVRSYLISGDESESRLKQIITKEQDILDSLSSSVITNINPDLKDVSFNDYLGIEFSRENDPVVLKMLEKLINPTNSSKYRIFKVFKVNNKTRTEEFNNWVNSQDNKSCQFLLHGTRNPNVFSILKGGLLIRPTNAAAISGAAYGNGIYHSAHTDKSLGYTGYDKDKVFFIQNVHMGNPYEYEGWYRGNSFSLTFENLKQRKYDSVYVKPGNGLRNSEYIVYNKSQSNTNYLVWLT